MTVKQILAFMKEFAVRGLVIVLAVLLVLIVASRNVEYELQQDAEVEQVQTTPNLTIR